jgi:hypothetical protein
MGDRRIERWARSRGRSPGPPGPRLLYLGVVLFALLAVLTARSIREEWRRRIGESRAQAVYALVADKMPARPTETPGVSAWLHVELERYRRQIADPERARLYGELAAWHDEASLPTSLTALREVLAAPGGGAITAERADPAPPARLLDPLQAGDPAAGSPPLQFRDVSYLDLGGRRLVVTRRRALAGTAAASPSDRFVARAAARLTSTAAALQASLARHPLPALPGDRPPQIVRIYAVSEDGTLVSLPFPAGGGAPNPAADRERAFAEGREFRKLAELPSFAANEFDFRFDFRDPAAQAYWSGLYLDLGGQGVVATLLAPLADPAAGAQAVLAIDLTFGIDWPRFAAGIEPPMTAAVVHVAPPPAGSFRPWAAMLHGLRGRPSEPRNRRPEPPVSALRAAVADLAAREARQGGAADTFYLYQGVAAGRGAVAAVQVAATTWLLVLFPAAQPGFPALPIALLALLLVSLLAGFEANRRRAVAAQGRAELAFAEKENLLNTMQVPLMVVDPNTDMVVYGNRAAAGLGIASGTRVADLIAPDRRARDHYDRMQVAAPEPRRAYGVPLQVRGPGGALETRYALVRSVAVTAPIEALHADERHRLGVLFLLEPDADLALFSADLVAETRADERQRLSGLLTHGVDTLARVLASVLASSSGAAAGGAAGDPFAAWLAAYLERRVQATAWLLARWDAAPPLPPDSSVEAAQARETIERFQTICARVREDAALRSQLHWDNGVLAPLPGAPPGNAPAFRVEIDWPDDYWFACPLAGGFGFFLGEVLGNAVRHGRPGTRPRLTILLDRVRRELVFTIENEPRATEADGRGDRRERQDRNDRQDRHDRLYSGHRILERLAHLFDWRDLRFEPGGGSGAELYRVTWRVPVSERGDPRRGD